MDDFTVPMDSLNVAVEKSEGPEPPATPRNDPWDTYLEEEADAETSS